ncbi:hypothetical protein Ctob_002457 [Chrysochromulina tobinii]|uniref:Uncharacterized protein n=1 Tax=Chrysochromulina tobinii TaxID=1460289 RepID=A0A0M0JEG4_9EUKA|nr:hypothetical protein Ctob_002457 [Chrysochromulina tobinii]|eukprot:KOO24961.1 hypothetical protein Ctob_002457 [Chrysochromulina sp. CCMP291]
MILRASCSTSSHRMAAARASRRAAASTSIPSSALSAAATIGDVAATRRCSRSCSATTRVETLAAMAWTLPRLVAMGAADAPGARLADGISPIGRSGARACIISVASAGSRQSSTTARRSSPQKVGPRARIERVAAADGTAPGNGSDAALPLTPARKSCSAPSTVSMASHTCAARCENPNEIPNEASSSASAELQTTRATARSSSVRAARIATCDRSNAGRSSRAIAASPSLRMHPSMAPMALSAPTSMCRRDESALSTSVSAEWVVGSPMTISVRPSAAAAHAASAASCNRLSDRSTSLMMTSSSPVAARSRVISGCSSSTGRSRSRSAATRAAAPRKSLAPSAVSKPPRERCTAARQRSSMRESCDA